jgi:hypothetical protein
VPGTVTGTVVVTGGSPPDAGTSGVIPTDGTEGLDVPPELVAVEVKV